MRKKTKAEIKIEAQKIAESWYCSYGLRNGYLICKDIIKILKREKIRRKALKIKTKKNRK